MKMSSTGNTRSAPTVLALLLCLLSPLGAQAQQGEPSLNPKALEYFRQAEALIGSEKEGSEEQAGLFAKAIELDPTFPEARQNLAIIYLKQRKFDQALTQLDELVRLRPNNPAVYLLRADAWLGKKDYPRAIAELEQVGRIDPGNGEAWEHLGNLQLQQKQYERAILSLQSAVQMPGAGPRHGSTWGSPFNQPGANRRRLRR